MRNLADRIRRARAIKGISQAGLARHLGVTTSAVGHWERPDGNFPSLENLIEVAQHLSVSFEWLAMGRGEMLPAVSCRLFPACDSLSDDEQALLEEYWKLPASSKILLAQYLKQLTPSPAKYSKRHKRAREKDWPAEPIANADRGIDAQGRS